MLSESRATNTVNPPLQQTLEPVRQALLDNARREAKRILDEARRSTAALVARSLAEADEEVHEARRRAESGAQAHSEQALARTLRKRHRLVLDAQEGIRRRLVDDVQAAARQIPSDPRYSDLLAHLESLALTQLGENAVVVRCRERDGGLIATADNKRVDYRLNTLANRALDSLSEKVVQLWI